MSVKKGPTEGTMHTDAHDTSALNNSQVPMNQILAMQIQAAQMQIKAQGPNLSELTNDPATRNMTANEITFYLNNKKWGYTSQKEFCTSCNKEVDTEVVKLKHCKQWVQFTVFAIVLLPCAPIPFLMKSYYRYLHHCPGCKCQLGERYSELDNPRRRRRRRRR
eukprot:403341062